MIDPHRPAGASGEQALHVRKYPVLGVAELDVL